MEAEVEGTLEKEPEVTERTGFAIRPVHKSRSPWLPAGNCWASFLTSL